MKLLSPNRFAALALVAAAMILLVVGFQTVSFNNTSTADGVDVGTVAVDDIPPIAESAAVEMVIPALNMRADFEANSCRFKNGAIDPATMDKACIYTAPDRPYTLPGTSAPDLAVIAGHTGAGVPGVFNVLYDGAADKHRVSVGDQLFVRTVESGDRWLVYTATDLHAPEKATLGEDVAVWGDAPMPGRLLTISCVQPANPLAASVKNAVVGWQFAGVSTRGAAGDGISLDRPATEIPALPASVVNAPRATR
ncbi:sortase family protein [Corynebacterium epidermidicanis]|uniref:Sortase family enzyme n=1 Tax=Corynebacterium epidermidicanis TaxID=1050174 RepID=A0A0G3GNY4_9CORY|nr:sortase [Corynebacterium epidermidicanis]AKK02941.1 hypothetical protein CEPID_05360 [Corynebacterium epidermidicanis]